VKLYSLLGDFCDDALFESALVTCNVQYIYFFSEMTSSASPIKLLRLKVPPTSGLLVELVVYYLSI
jgi:hypothetical protein